MAERLILCSECGVRNRIPEGKRGQSKCGRCSKLLAVPRNSRGFVGLLKKPMTWLVVIGLLFVGYLAVKKQSSSSRYIGARASDSMALPKPPPNQGYRTSSPPSYTPSSPTVYKPPIKPPFDAKPIPVLHGILQPPSSPGLAPFRLKTRAGHNYYVKVVDLAEQLVMTMYAEGGRDLKTKVPLGTFKIRYASGKTWYGTKLRFGPKTSYAKAVEIFEFKRIGNKVTGYTVELIPQIGGNMRTIPISPEEF